MIAITSSDATCQAGMLAISDGNEVRYDSTEESSNGVARSSQNSGKRDTGRGADQQWACKLKMMRVLVLS